MSRKIKVKPGKGQSTVGFIVGIVFCFIGLFAVIPTFGPFGIFWTVIAVVITVTNGMNAFSDKGVTSHEIVIDDGTELNTEGGRYGTDSQKRLEELKNLYDNDLMTKEEYDEKRKEIIDDI